MFLVNVSLIHMFSLSLVSPLTWTARDFLLPVGPCEGVKVQKPFFRVISLQLYAACSLSVSTCLRCNAHHVTIRPQSPGASSSPAPPHLFISILFDLCAGFWQNTNVCRLSQKKNKKRLSSLETLCRRNDGVFSRQ